MLAQLAQCEFAVMKSRLSALMSAAELQNYENLSQQIETGIEAAKRDIESTKLEFQDAKTVRKNRIEYDVLAKVINKQPDRKETDEKLSQLRKELGSLEVSCTSESNHLIVSADEQTGLSCSLRT
jgi:THO complex subunit 7